MRRTLRVVRPSEEPVRLVRVVQEEEAPQPVNPRPHAFALQEMTVLAGNRVVKKLFPVPGGFREERGA